MIFNKNGSGRLSPRAGIAIGPILFIIAILAILAAAIAAGSGSFTAGTGSESNRTKSSALVEIGENLKVGMDNIILEGGISPANVIIDPAKTGQDSTAASELFSPTGGGIAAPSVNMANAPGTDKWHYIAGPLPGIGSGGTGTAGDFLAILPVSDGVCQEVNNRSTGTATIPTGADYGNFLGDSEGVVGTATFAGWPTTGPNLVGVSTGCVHNTDSSSTGYYFYQVIAIQ